jgi:hypothetical protein
LSTNEAVKQLQLKFWHENGAGYDNSSVRAIMWSVYMSFLLRKSQLAETSKIDRQLLTKLSLESILTKRLQFSKKSE